MHIPLFVYVGADRRIRPNEDSPSRGSAQICFLTENAGSAEIPPFGEASVCRLSISEALKREFLFYQLLLIICHLMAFELWKIIKKKSKKPTKCLVVRFFLLYLQSHYFDIAKNAIQGVSKVITLVKTR